MDQGRPLWEDEGLGQVNLSKQWEPCRGPEVEMSFAVRITPEEYAKIIVVEKGLDHLKPHRL